MEGKITFDQRRASAFSTRSTKSMRQRKYSNDRFQRQAELSLLIEEHRPTNGRPPLVREESVEEEFVQDFFSKASSANVRSLSRADTGLSPLEVHPGHRVRGFSLAGEGGSAPPDDDSYGAFVTPFAEPEEVERQVFEHEDFHPRYPSVHGVDTEAIDVGPAQSEIQRAASAARQRNTYLRRLYHRLRGPGAIKPGLLRGLEYVSWFAMSHANATFSGATSRAKERRALYALDFELEGGLLKVAPPKSFSRIAELRQFLLQSSPEPVLRIIYSCNNEEAFNYISEAFGITDASEEDSDRNFRDWMQNDRSSRGAANKVIRWRPSYDPARHLIGTAFGLDFGSIVLSPSRRTVGSSFTTRRRGHDHATLHRQRLSVYMQRGRRAEVLGPRLTSFNTGSRNLHPFASIDTVIISEYSSGDVGEIIRVASLLSPDLNHHHLPAAGVGNNPELVVPAALESILTDVFARVRQVWTRQLSHIQTEFAALEDHVYAQPADTSRARDVWALAQHLHDMLKLVNRHGKLMEWIQKDFRVFAERGEEEQEEWLDPVIDEFAQISSDLGSDYIQPLEYMIDLMYKSVNIHHSRLSVELSVSIWRLSWITFIFLPLTFLVGIFSMNVDVLQNHPSIRWYFAAAASMMVLVLLSWFLIRRFLPGAQALNSVGYSESDLLRLRNVEASGSPGMSNEPSN